MGKHFLLFLAILFILAVYVSRKIKDDNLPTIQGRFLKIVTSENKFCTLYLKLNNDSIAVFKTAMAIDDPNIEVFKNGGFDIVVTYKEYNNPITNTVDKIVQSILPVYNINIPQGNPLPLIIF
jgi:hypothetical protein